MDITASMERMQQELEEILAFVHESMAEHGPAADREALVRIPPPRLMRTGLKKR